MVSADRIHVLGYEGGCDFVEIEPVGDDSDIGPYVTSRVSSVSRWGVRRGFRVTDDGAGRRLRRSVMPSVEMQDELFLSGAAIESVGPLLEPFGELLPVEFEGGTAYVFHCLHVVDAIDVGRARPLYAPDVEAKVLSFGVYAFRPGVVPDGCAFTLPEGQPPWVFYTGGLVAAITAAADITGVWFGAVWTAQDGPLPRPTRLD